MTNERRAAEAEGTAIDPTRIAAWENDALVPVEKMDAHLRGLRHPAISVFLVDGDRTLLQRRAFGKYHTPGLWTNSCCTHPHWGEDPSVCAARRLREELGLDLPPPKPMGAFEYRADVGGGLIEHEVVELFVIDVSEEALRPEPNPEEVAETRWVSFEALADEIARTPERFTPWLRIYMHEIPERIGARG